MLLISLYVNLIYDQNFMSSKMKVKRKVSRYLCKYRRMLEMVQISHSTYNHIYEMKVALVKT